jgi:hypothetical protein
MRKFFKVTAFLGIEGGIDGGIDGNNLKVSGEYIQNISVYTVIADM